MDERTFQHELHQLKQRVANMADRYSDADWQFSPSPFLPRDDFLAQMSDVKRQVAALSSTLKHQGGTTAIPESPQIEPVATASAAQEWQHGEFSNPQHAADFKEKNMHLTLPSGPLFWQMFSSLRSDVHSVEGRVSNLEWAVETIENRIDGLDPNRFTPASSTGIPEHVANANQHMSTAQNFQAEEDKISLGYPGSDWQRRASAVSHCAEVPASQREPQRGPELDVRSLSMQEVSEAFLRNQLCASSATVDMLRKFNETTQAGLGHLDQTNATLMREIVQLQSKHADYVWEWMAHPDPSARHLAASPRELDAPVDQQYVAHSSGPLEIPGRQRNAETTMLHEAAAQKPAGLLFRDREIARLEELLKDSQESARMSEEKAARCEEAVQSAEANSAAWAAKSQEQDERLGRTNEVLSQHERAIHAYESYARKVEARREELLEQCTYEVKRGKEKSAMLSAADQKIEQMQLLLRETQDSRRDLHEMVGVRDADIRELQAFCEQKDTIAQSQEQIIARGAKLMEQKDEEIEALTRRLKTAEDDNAHEKRQTARLSRLLEERDREIKDATNDLAETVTPELPPRPPKAAETAERSEAQSAPSPFAVSGSKRDGRYSWSPTSIRGFRRLPSEEHRASASASEPTMTQPVFGEASPIGHSRRYMNARGDRRHHGSEAARARPSRGQVFGHGEASSSTSHDERPEPSPTTKEDRSSLGTPASQGQAPSNHVRAEERRRLPMDRTFWPPLPVPVVGGASAANRMQSMADLRSSAAKEERSANDRGERISKHQSMRELKRRHQAYVETEAESGGELGGDV